MKQQFKYAVGRFVRRLDSGDFEGRLSGSLLIAWIVVSVLFALVAIRTGIIAEARYSSTLGEPFARAAGTHDAGKAAAYLEQGIRGVEEAGLTNGHAVTVWPAEPSNDTGIVTQNLQSLIVRAREIDRLDHSGVAYQQGMQDLKARMATMDHGLYFARWNRLNGYWLATFRSIGWAIWNSLLFACIAFLDILAIEFAVVRFYRLARDWEAPDLV